MDDVQCFRGYGLVCWLGDCGSGRQCDDHGYIGLSERDGYRDGRSGRFIGHTVTDESELRIDRCDVDTECDGQRRSWNYDQ